MNYGLYLSASGVLSNLYRQDVFANNLANVNTVGFKPDVATIAQRAPEAIEDGLGPKASHELLDRLGGGALAGPQRVDFTPGPLRDTGGPLDVALDTKDTFFVVSAIDQAGNTEMQFTRDGRFIRGQDGYLVNATSGAKVVGTDDQPILIPDTSAVQIDAAGHVLQNGETVGQLQVAKITDPGKLIKQGKNQFKLAGPASLRVKVESPQIRTGMLESSGVDPITAMMKLIEATKAVTGNGNLIRYHDLLMDRAVNVLGRVA